MFPFRITQSTYFCMALQIPNQGVFEPRRLLAEQQQELLESILRPHDSQEKQRQGFRNIARRGNKEEPQYP